MILASRRFYFQPVQRLTRRLSAETICRPGHVPQGASSMKSFRFLLRRPVGSLMRAVLTIALIVALPRNAPAVESPATVAGRTQEAWIAELRSADAVARRRAVLSLGAFGSSAAPAL